MCDVFPFAIVLLHGLILLIGLAGVNKAVSTDSSKEKIMVLKTITVLASCFVLGGAVWYMVNHMSCV